MGNRYKRLFRSVDIQGKNEKASRTSGEGEAKSDGIDLQQQQQQQQGIAVFWINIF